jgi:hypothetical protein
MTIRIFVSVLFVLCLAARPASAQQRPLVTEDPETVGLNRTLIEAGVEFDKDQLYPAAGLRGDTTHIATFGVSVGIGPSAEIQIDGGFLQRLTITERLVSSSPFEVGDSVSTLEDFVVATKIRLVSETETRPTVGVRFGTKLPTADAEKVMGLGTTDFFATFLMAKTVQSVRTVGNAGFVVLGNPLEGRDHARALSFGVSIARALTNEFELVGELNGRFKPFGDSVDGADLGTGPLGGRGVFRFAGRYTYSLFRLDAGLLLGLTARDPSFGITAGATYVISR